MTATHIADELGKFSAHAKAKGLNLAGNEQVFFKGKTARAWTAWLARARALFGKA